jgi:hypothetical protein
LREERERRVLTTEGSDTKLRIIGRLDLLVSQPSLYICVGQYTIVMVEVAIQEYDYNISYILYIKYFLYIIPKIYKQISDANDQGKTNNVRILDQTQSILKSNKKNNNRYNKKRR